MSELQTIYSIFLIILIVNLVLRQFLIKQFSYIILLLAGLGIQIYYDKVGVFLLALGLSTINSFLIFSKLKQKNILFYLSNTLFTVLFVYINNLSNSSSNYLIPIFFLVFILQQIYSYQELIESFPTSNQNRSVIDSMKSILEFIVFSISFPYCFSSPIRSFSNFRKHYKSSQIKPLELHEILNGIFLVLLAFFMKNVLGSNLNEITVSGFQSGSLNIVQTWALMLVYYLQIILEIITIYLITVGLSSMYGFPSTTYLLRDIRSLNYFASIKKLKMFPFNRISISKSNKYFVLIAPLLFFAFRAGIKWGAVGYIIIGITYFSEEIFNNIKRLKIIAQIWSIIILFLSIIITTIIYKGNPQSYFVIFKGAISFGNLSEYLSELYILCALNLSWTLLAIVIMLLIILKRSFLYQLIQHFDSLQIFEKGVILVILTFLIVKFGTLSPFYFSMI